MKDLFGILVIVNVSMINHMILDNICIMKIVTVEKNVDKLVEECSENIDGNEMIYNTARNKKVCNSCTIQIVFLVIFFIISISISSVFIYFHWYLKRDNTHVKLNTNTQTTIY